MLTLHFPVPVAAQIRIYGVFFIPTEPATSAIRRIIAETGVMPPAEIVRPISKLLKRI